MPTIRRRGLATLCLLAACATACAPRTAPPPVDDTASPAPPDRAADAAAIRSLIATTAERNNAGDVEGWVSLFADDAVYLAPDLDEITDRAGLVELARGGFSTWDAAVRIEPREIVVDADWAFARNRVSGSVTPKGGGEAVPIDQKQIVLYHRQADGSWKIARMIANRNPS